MDSDTFFFVLGMLVGVVLLVIIVGAIGGAQGFFFVYDHHLVCEERGFDSWSKVDDVIVCIRGEGERSEIRSTDWVGQHCNNVGICTSVDGEAISRPVEGGEK